VVSNFVLHEGGTYSFTGFHQHLEEEPLFAKSDLQAGSAAAALGVFFPREKDKEFFPFVQALRELTGRGDTTDDRPPGWGVVPWRVIREGVNRLAVRSAHSFVSGAAVELISGIIFTRERASLHRSAVDESVGLASPLAITFGAGAKSMAQRAPMHVPVGAAEANSQSFQVSSSSSKRPRPGSPTLVAIVRF
jgi:hypothetical protein